MSPIFNIKHLGGSLAGQNQRMVLKEGQAIRLGRDPGSDIKFSEATDDNVSAVHAELTSEGGRLYVEDKRSSNGTFVNGAPCPAFEKIAVPDGSRIRLAKNGPEMQVTFDQVASAAEIAPPPPPAGDSSLPPKESVGRETMLREIDRAKQEERDVMTSEVSKSKRMTMLMVAAVALLAVGLVAVAGFGIYKMTQKDVEQVSKDVEQVSKDATEEARRNIWADIEQSARPAVAHIRCRYHLEQPQLVTGDAGVTIQMKSVEVTGTAVLVRRDLLLTAKHVVEPWKFSIDWNSIEGFSNWEQFAETNKITPVYEAFEVQFPGFQPVKASTFAISGTSDLALISIPEVKLTAVPVATSNRAVNVTDDVGIIGYPLNLGERQLVTFDFTSANMAMTQLTSMDPTFLKGTVTRAVPEVGETSHYFYLDASVEPGNSGGPVLNKNGEVIGIVSQKLVIGKPIEFNGAMYPSFKEIRSSARAVSPDDMKKFLTSVGVL